MRGYKVFNPDWTCLEFQYEVGKTYETDKTLKICERGFHFCKVAVDCFNYYQFDSSNKVAEVIAHGEVVEEGDKCVTNKLEIVREIEWHEVLNMVNIGKGNTGHRNTGDGNTGYWNKTNYSSGCFCTEEPNILFFDLPSDWSYQDWIDSEQRGILWCMPTENRQSWWNKLDNQEKESIKSLPNFNAQKFHDITGIEVE